jgi:hypothetical protein
VCKQFCENLGESMTETLAMTRPTLKEESMRQKFHSPRPEKAKKKKSEVKSMLIIFFVIKGIGHKELVLASQTVNSP